MTLPPQWLVPASSLDAYDTIIDVRSPAEYAQDHIPGAWSCPVLDDEERARVGTLYRQQSAFVARRLGAVLVARRIAEHLEQFCGQQPKSWRPLLYCWRGGQRSASMQLVMRQIGWQADRVEGGYKAFRHLVISKSAAWVGQMDWRIISGSTGSGKTRLLHALARQGGQVLDLEALAAHKGSVLGAWPGQAQPTQKMFETRIWQQLRQLDRQQPVYVEAESRKIGNVHLPDALMAAMQQAPCMAVEASLPARVEFLLRDYAYACQPQWVQERMQRLVQRQGRQVVAQWQQLADAGRWAELVQALLEQHYDPLYRQSQSRRQRPGSTLHLATLDDAALDAAAAQLLAQR